MEPREMIARRIAREFKDGDIVNLGIGMPTMVADYVPQDIEIILHSENGFVGLGPSPAKGEEDKDICNAGGQPASILPGGAFFDSTMSFTIVRGGHLDVTVLGALEVDCFGNLANYMVPGKMVPGMGGAMDLTVGARRVIIAMEHTNKNGSPKIRSRCTLPLTACGEVDLIVTEKAVIKVDGGELILTEMAPGLSVEELQKITEATLTISPDLKVMDVGGPYS